MKCIANSKKNFFIKNNVILLLKCYIIINSFIPIFSLLNLNSFQLKVKHFLSEIRINITGNNIQNILNSENCPCPDEIYMDDSKIGEGVCSLDLGTQENNAIKMVWFNELTTCKRMFSSLTNIVQIDLSSFDSSLVIDMSYMFENCISLKLVNVSYLNTSSVTTMEGMFYRCSSLKSLDIYHFDTKLVTNMNEMFFFCESLQYLNLSNLNTESVNDMNSMFYRCNLLSSLDLSSFNTFLVVNMDSMFAFCESLTSLNLSNFHTPLITNMKKMLSGCRKLQTLDISNFNTQLVTDMEGLFSGCSSLTSLNLSNFNTYLSYTFQDFFYNCSSLKILDISYFNTTLTENMNGMFSGCSSLTSLDSSHFNTRSLEYMEGMFSNCSSLVLLNISNFNTDKVRNMDNMFYNCKSLSSLDLFSFNISSVSSLSHMFYNCELLKTINLSLFDISKVTDMTNMFNNCKNLQYINLQNAIELDSLMVTNIFGFIKENIVYCVNEEEAPKISKLLKEKKCSTKDCSNNWKNSVKFISDDLTCHKVCPTEEFFLGICKIDDSKIEEREIIGQKIINDIMDGSIDNILSDLVNNNTNLIIKEKNQTYHLSTISSQKENFDSNLTIIDLGECENILKSKHGINEDEDLIIFKIENYITGLKIPIIEYVIFTKDGKKQLNLDYCDEIPIQYYIPISINESELYKYNSSSDFYNDGCNTYTTEYGTDMTLYDRKNEYNNNNLSLCESNCEFKGYNSSRAECECKIKNKINFFTDINIDKNELIDQLINIKKISNIWVFKCINLLLSRKGLIDNIGSYIILSTIFSDIICSILFCKIGYNILSNTIKKIIEIKFNYTFEENQKSSPPKKSKIKYLNSQNNNLITTNPQNNALSEFHTINKGLENIKFLQRNDNELNSLSYEDAIKYDKRTYWEYYFSLIRTKQLFVFTFYTYTDYNSRLIKICLLLFFFALFYIINALFFNDSTMHQIYEDHGVFNFIFQLPQIIYSTIISVVIKKILTILSLTENNILEVKNQETSEMAIEKMKKILKCLLLKFILFFVFNFLFLLLFWYYISCFCAVYKNTQVYLIKDTIISFATSLINPFAINLIPGLLRIPSLISKNNACLYRISKIIQLF